MPKKKTIGKRLVEVVAVLCILACVALIVLVVSLDKLVKAGIEKVGTAKLGVTTSLQKVSLSIPRQSIRLEGLKLGSPDGFKAPEMFTLGDAFISVDLWSLKGDEIVVKDVILENAQVTLEMSDRTSNWGAVSARLKKEKQEPEAEKKMRLDHLVLKNARLRVAGIPMLGETSIPLPDIELKDIRSQQGTGEDLSKVLQAVIDGLNTAIMQAVEKAAQPQNFGKLASDLRTSLGEAGGGIEGAGGEMKGAVKSGLKGVKGAIDGMLGKEKKEKQE